MAEHLFRIAEIEIDPAQIEQYKALLKEEVEASLQLEPGVLFLQAVALKDAPNNIRVFECYADEAAYQHHITTPHFLKYKMATSHMVKLLRLMEANPIAVQAKA
ncbi:putative quinol monooxygenase [Aestuariivirga litoralis]|uniref:putative quinol monooxygenase n=1 Tax=Aestuariivirga litoralis TaxID=2650924 RepID=UPI0018C74707|nr:antibiotic biosynthesis monooxygenase [Aestuariivirga litoralis]MBG1231130.1 antibiotic biosynthesis monooxygenase [Aestuariivirga litoralis]